MSQPSVTFYDRLDRLFDLPAQPGQRVDAFLHSHHIPLDAVVVRRNGSIVSETEVIGDGDTITVEMVRAYRLPDFLRANGIWKNWASESPPSNSVYTKRLLWFGDKAHEEFRTTHLTAESFPSFLEDIFATSIEHAHLLEADDNVGLALSGGRDSLALLYLLKQTRDRLPPVELHVITVCGLDTPIDTEIAREATAAFGVTHHFVSPEALTEIFGLNVNPEQALSEIYKKYGAERIINCSHALMRAGVEYEAARLGVKKIAFGLHNEDLLASLLRMLVNGMPFGESFYKKRWGPFNLIYPLWGISKKELTIYLDLVAPAKHSSQGSPNLYDRGGANRDIQYFVADNLQSLWPGFSYHAFEGYKKLADKLAIPSFGECVNCKAAFVTEADFHMQPCPLCNLLIELDLLTYERRTRFS